MKYLMQIRTVCPITKEAFWISVKASHLAEPYEYDTREEAEDMLRICYGGAICRDEMRVIPKP